MTFRFQRLEIPEVILIEPKTFLDRRGFFMEIYKCSEFANDGVSGAFVQDNYSHSVRGVLRGLHYQKHPKAQGKLVMALRGEIFDVAVDIRRGSPTYGKWIGVDLSGENHFMLYIPVGFVHGFCVRSDEADVLYSATVEYAPDCERGIVWNDPQFGITWPVQSPILSLKDACLPAFREADHNFVYEGSAR